MELRANPTLNKSFQFEKGCGVLANSLYKIKHRFNSTPVLLISCRDRKFLSLNLVENDQGIGMETIFVWVFSVAKPMMSEVFGNILPTVVTQLRNSGRGLVSWSLGVFSLQNNRFTADRAQSIASYLFMRENQKESWTQQALQPLTGWNWVSFRLCLWYREPILTGLVDWWGNLQPDSLSVDRFVLEHCNVENEFQKLVSSNDGRRKFGIQSSLLSLHSLDLFLCRNGRWSDWRKVFLEQIWGTRTQLW